MSVILKDTILLLKSHWRKKSKEGGREVEELVKDIKGQTNSIEYQSVQLRQQVESVGDLLEPTFTVEIVNSTEYQRVQPGQQVENVGD